MPWHRQLADIPFVGTFRRQIDLRAWDEHTVVGWLEDEFHHIGVTLVHDGATIRALDVAMVRYPWTTCPAADEPLRALVGRPLTARCGAVAAMVDLRCNCTHLLDLTTLAVAHAHARRGHRRYHGTVQALSDLRTDGEPGQLRATLYRDEEPVLAWDMREFTICAPDPFSGRSILHGFREWTEGLDVAAAEDALVLRRVAFVASGRQIQMDHIRIASDLGQGPVCHSFQPARSATAVKVGSTHRRFDSSPDAMLGMVGTRP